MQKKLAVFLGLNFFSSFLFVLSLLSSFYSTNVAAVILTLFFFFWLICCIQAKRVDR